MKNAPLAGLGILVTRPAHQSEHLANLILQAGGNPVLFPALEIVDVADLQPLNALIDQLDHFDLAIFISPNAGPSTLAGKGCSHDLFVTSYVDWALEKDLNCSLDGTSMAV